MKQKILLIFHGRFPSEKAAALFAAKSAEAFSGLGFSVELIVPKRRGTDPYTANVAYGIPTIFSIRALPILDLFFLPFAKSIAFWTSYVTFSISVWWYIFFQKDRAAIVYSNEILPLWAASFACKKTVYEMHDFPESKLWLFRILMQRVWRFIIHNRWKAEKAKSLFGIPREHVLVEFNAADMEAFNIEVSKTNARTRLGLSQDKHLVVYTGHLYGWKGVNTLADAAALLPDSYLVVFVGGTPQDVEYFKKRHASKKNIFIVGHRPYTEIPLWQKAADILALPNSGQEAISKYYTSPMKLFEYMASKRVIVASNIPSVVEITGQDLAILVPPDNPNALAQGIVSAASDSNIAKGQIENAFAFAVEHTWRKRAERITSFLELESTIS